jgi:hypothetical protein
MWIFSRPTWRRYKRSAVAASTLVAVLACAVGVPLPAVVVKSHAERYPCENHPCGCADAESCWQDCCCMTDDEKLAWAEQAGVSPPHFVAVRAARELAANATKALAAGDCCRAKSDDCCSAARSCDDAGSCAAESHLAPVPSRGVKFVLLHAAMKCRGLTVSVALLPPSLPALAADFWPAPVGQFSASLPEPLLYDSPHLAIESPPPDVARA